MNGMTSLKEFELFPYVHLGSKGGGRGKGGVGSTRPPRWSPLRNAALRGGMEKKSLLNGLRFGYGGGTGPSAQPRISLMVKC